MIIPLNILVVVEREVVDTMKKFLGDLVSFKNNRKKIWDELQVGILKNFDLNVDLVPAILGTDNNNLQANQGVEFNGCLWIPDMNVDLKKIAHTFIKWITEAISSNTIDVVVELNNLVAMKIPCPS